MAYRRRDGRGYELGGRVDLVRVLRRRTYHRHHQRQGHLLGDLRVDRDPLPDAVTGLSPARQRSLFSFAGCVDGPLRSLFTRRCQPIVCGLLYPLPGSSDPGRLLIRSSSKLSISPCRSITSSSPTVTARIYAASIGAAHGPPNETCHLCK